MHTNTHRRRVHAVFEHPVPPVFEQLLKVVPFGKGGRKDKRGWKLTEGS
jgi:hypothetical protein